MISKSARREILAALGERYGRCSRPEKSRILDQVMSLTGCHRKHAVRLLRNGVALLSSGERVSRRVYDEAVREALIVIWEAADRICGKRLVAILPSLVRAMELHGHLRLEESVRQRLLAASASSIDRLLAPVRTTAKGERKRKRAASKASKQIPTRTFADWQEPPPGYLEIDFVAHCGTTVAGSYLNSLVVTDVYSGWTEAVVLLAREQSLVVEGLDVLRQRLPMPVLGIDSDNDGAFINDTLLGYCQTEGLEFTRSRAYRKNDQAWIEQKNGAVVRRFVGYARLSGIVAGQSLSYLYELLRQYVNHFQPSFKLREKVRNGSRVHKSYHKPATPCDRLLAHEALAPEQKESLTTLRSEIDPLDLLHRIRNAQEAIVALVGEPSTHGPEDTSLDEFLAQLPRLWKAGEARPTHRQPKQQRRYWRTRIDPFEGVWAEVLSWLQADPDATAKSLFERLDREHPGRFPKGQLRTLQRRVREWRHVMAKHLVYSCLDGIH